MERNLSILAIKEVAEILHCSVDTVRRIPWSELPYSRVGKKNLYLLDDVTKLVRDRQAANSKASAGGNSNPATVIDSLADDVRGRSQ